LEQNGNNDFRLEKKGREEGESGKNPHGWKGEVVFIGEGVDKNAPRKKGQGSTKGN